MEWHRIASHLHLTVRECKSRINSMEFVTWLAYFEEDLNGFHREDYFLAQVAQLVMQANSKDPRKVKLDQFLLKFDKKKPETAPSEEMIRLKQIQSRAVWGLGLGVEIPIDDLMPDDESNILKGPWEDE